MAGIPHHAAEEISRGIGRLSQREQEVLGLAAVGYLDKQISLELDLSLNTLRKYWRRIRGKVGDLTRSALVAAYIDGQMKHAGLDRSVANLVSDEDNFKDPIATLRLLPGRSRETEALRDSVRRRPLTSVVGPPGVGKTAIAMMVGAEVCRATGRELKLVRVPEGAGAEIVCGAILSAFGARSRDGRSSAELVADAIASRPAVLVLDDCGQEDEIIRHVVGDLLRQCPRLKVIAIGISCLSLDGEGVIELSALDIPAPASRSFRVLHSLGSVEAFSLLGRKSQSDFRVTKDNIGAVAAICRLGGGNPLALDLLARWLPRSPILEISASLAQFASVCEHVPDPDLGYPSSLEITLGWVFDRLTASQQVILVRLSILGPTWNTSAAYAVCCDAETSPEHVLSTIAELSELHLLTTEVATTQEFCWSNSVRQFALRRLHRTGDFELVVSRLENYCLRFVEEVEQAFDRGQDEHALYLADGFYSTIRTMLGIRDSCANTQSLGLCAGLVRYWTLRGLWAEGREHCESLLGAHADGRSRLKFAVVYGIARFAWLRGDFDAVDVAIEIAREVCRDLQPDGRNVRSLLSFGAMALSRNSIGYCRIFCSAARELSQQLCDPVGEAMCERQLCSSNVVAGGELEEAYKHLQQVLGVFRHFGEREQEAQTNMTLGDFAVMMGDLDSAKRDYGAGAALARELHQSGRELYSMCGLGYVALYKGEFFLAKVLFKSVLASTRVHPNWSRDYRCIEGLALCAFAEHREDQGLVLWYATACLRRTTAIPRIVGVQRNLDSQQVERVEQMVGQATVDATMARAAAMSFSEAVSTALAAESEFDVAGRVGVVRSATLLR